MGGSSIIDMSVKEKGLFHRLLHRTYTKEHIVDDKPRTLGCAMHYEYGGHYRVNAKCQCSLCSGQDMVLHGP